MPAAREYCEHRMKRNLAKPTHQRSKKISAIDSISFTYKTDAGNIITESEVKAYINSLDFLEQTLRFTQTCFLIIEYNTWTYLYCSSNTNEVLGYSSEFIMDKGPAFGLNTYYDEDLETQRSIHPMIVDVFSKLPETEKSRCRFSFTSRMKHGNGEEVALLQSDFFLKWNSEGKPLVKLITLTDISNYKKNKDVVFYVTRVNESRGNEVILQKNFSREVAPLSSRELSIVQLISSGYTVKDIAEHFSLSVNTVKNHKQNIMTRLGAKNSAEVVSLAQLYGLASVNLGNKATN
jgi:DNA-binding CsgD family transcriptional regulator